MVRKKVTLCLLLCLPMLAFAQREASVHGKSDFIVTDHDHLTLAEAKLKCVEKAKAEAIKAEFGEIVISDVLDSNVESNGSTASSYFWENTAAMSKGEWLGDTQPSKINVEYRDGNLIFSAEVWGMAREIVQAKTDLTWDILKDFHGRKDVTTSFENGERIFLNMRVPADGYLAVYLTVGDGETFCLLPYPKDSDGRFPIKGGKDYVLFDRESDPLSPNYTMTTKHRKEANQLVVIYSPNPFTKCNDISTDPRHPNMLSTNDFQKWLLKCQRNDKEMVVDKKWMSIHNAKADN